MPRIGPYTLHKIETGTFGLDGGAMFGVVPKPLWEQRIPADGRNRIPLAMRCLLLESSDRLILVDNGLGHKYTEKFAALYAIDHETHTLERSLRSAGFGFDDVTDVVLTHLHFDHTGGSTTLDGGKLAVVFRNARHYVQRKQWDTANDPNPRESPSFQAENLRPLEASGQLVLLDGEQSPFAGVTLTPVSGHTAGMQIVRVADGSRTLVFAADLLPTSHHFGPAWTMAYDIEPLKSMSEKAAFLSAASQNGWTIMFEHDPVVEIAEVADSDGRMVVKDARSVADFS